MDRSSNKDSICESILILGGEMFIKWIIWKNNPSKTLYSNYLTTNASTTYSTPNRWDNTSGKHNHSNEKIPNNARYNNSFNEFSNNHFHPYYQNSFTSMKCFFFIFVYWFPWWIIMEISKQIWKRNILSNENAIDYRKQEPHTVWYIKPSQQQKRNCLQMRIVPTIVYNKENIFKIKLMEKYF